MFWKNKASFGYALKGIIIGFTEESSFRIHVAIGAIAIGLGIYCELSTIEWLFIISVIGFVLTAELFNTSLEELCDMMRSTHDPHVAKIKDLAAGAVLVASGTAAIIGACVFLPHLLT